MCAQWPCVTISTKVAYATFCIFVCTPDRWAEYINQMSSQSELRNRNCFSATSKMGSLIFTQDLWELSESVATINMDVDSEDIKGTWSLPKEGHSKTLLYSKRAQK